MVLDKQLGALHTDLQATDEEKDSGPGIGFCNLKVNPQ